MAVSADVEKCPFGERAAGQHRWCGRRPSLGPSEPILEVTTASDLGPRTPWPADRPGHEAWLAAARGRRCGACAIAIRTRRGCWSWGRRISRFRGFSWVECGETVGQEVAFDGVLGE